MGPDRRAGKWGLVKRERPAAPGGGRRLFGTDGKFPTGLILLLQARDDQLGGGHNGRDREQQRGTQEGREGLHDGDYCAVQVVALLVFGVHFFRCSLSLMGSAGFKQLTAPKESSQVGMARG